MQEGLDVEHALLLGGAELPGHIHTDEVYFALSPGRRGGGAATGSQRSY